MSEYGKPIQDLELHKALLEDSEATPTNQY